LGTNSAAHDLEAAQRRGHRPEGAIGGDGDGDDPGADDRDHQQQVPPPTQALGPRRGAIWGRVLKGHFTPKQHFAFEGVAWYWHFVDVVWLGLFIFVYWL
jgi:hypothetical protein